jgi:hypothetical protein
VNPQQQQAMYQQQMGQQPMYQQPYGGGNAYAGHQQMAQQRVPQTAEGKSSISSSRHGGEASMEERIIAIVTTVQERPSVSDANQLIDRIKGRVEGAEDDLGDETYGHIKGVNDLGTTHHS